MKDTLTILKDAYALFADRNRFTTGTAARNEFGFAVQPWDPEAVRFCAAGIVWKAAGYTGDFHEPAHDSAMRAHDELRRTLGKPIAEINDGPNGHDAMCEAYRDTIARLTPQKEKTETPAEALVGAP